jgi:IcmF-related N-terminal domain
MFSQLIGILAAPLRQLLELPLRLLSAPRRLWGLSLPNRVALATLVAGFIILGVQYYFWQKSGEPAKTWTQAVAVILVIVVSVVTNYAVRVWLETETSEFDDIDRAWKAGMDQLAAERLNLDEIPLYIVLGPHTRSEAAHLLHSSGIELVVKGVPEAAEAPLHWFGGPDAIFIVCTRSCRLSLVGDVAAKHVPGAARFGKTIADPAPGAARGTMMSQTETIDGPTRFAGTVGPSGADSESSTRDVGAEFVPPAAPQRYGATMSPATTPVGDSSVFPSRRAQTPSRAPVVVRKDEADEATDRLEYLCRLIRKARQPFSPINGVLTVLPFSLLERTDNDTRELQKAIHEDLARLHSTLQLRCQVIVLTGGMEKEEGFLELMRRVGAEAAKTQRFGKGFNPWSPPLPEQLEAVGKHACGMFEDWTYALFSERKGYEKIGNPKLYELLCKIRSQVAKRLSDLLANAYGHDPDPESPLPMLFSGCYFAATGQQDDKQVFVKSVFDKLVEQQDCVDWTEPALRENDRYQNLANLCYCLSGLLIVAIGGILWLRFHAKS